MPAPHRFVAAALLATVCSRTVARAQTIGPPPLGGGPTPYGGAALHSPVSLLPPANEFPAGYSFQESAYLDGQLFDDPSLSAPARPGLQPPPLPPGTREGIFQKATLLGTWLPQPETGDLGSSALEASVVFGFPFPHRNAPLVITPSFGVHYLDGPTTPDLPPRLYDAGIEWRHMRQLTPRLGMDVAVTTGYYSDFEQSNGDAFRITGRGLAAYDWSPLTKLVLGVAYLNRAGATVLPVGGFVFQPNDSLRWELVVPRPRVAWRLDRFSTPTICETWCYISGEFGGGVWEIQRASGAPDVVEYRDYRVLVGLEQKRPGYLSSRFEIGYVFGRELEFASATPDYQPGATLLLRYGLTY